MRASQWVNFSKIVSALKIRFWTLEILLSPTKKKVFETFGGPKSVLEEVSFAQIDAPHSEKLKTMSNG